MRVPRLYVATPLTPGTEVELGSEVANHITRVLRLRPGATLRLFDGSGREFSAQLLRCHKQGASATVEEALVATPESPLQLTLAQGISRGERMDYTLQKAVELGVNHIVPLAAERSVVQLDAARAETRLRHWQGVIIAACEQCGRSRLPSIDPPQPPAQWLAQPPSGLGLILDPRAHNGLPQLPRSDQVVLLIGPEGGWAPEELEAALQAGYQGVRLGPRILRTETAAVTALAALQTLWGDLGAV